MVQLARLRFYVGERTYLDVTLLRSVPLLLGFGAPARANRLSGLRGRAGLVTSAG